MFDNIRYCDLCHRRLTPEDFAIGDAIERRGKAYCNECAEIAPQTAKQPPVIVPKAPRPSASSRRLKAAKRPSASSRRLKAAKRPNASSRRLKAVKRRGRKTRRRSSAGRPAGARAVPRPEKQKGSERTVTVSATCPHCGESFLAEDPDFSRDFFCPACGKGIRLKRPRPGPGSGRHA